MKPTLFTDDMVPTDIDKPMMAHGKALIGLSNILPTRCDGINGEHIAYPFPCSCDGVGWLYPDMPDDFEAEKAITPRFEVPRGEAHCRETWRAMGILEEERCQEHSLNN